MYSLIDMLSSFESREECYRCEKELKQVVDTLLSEVLDAKHSIIKEWGMQEDLKDLTNDQINRRYRFKGGNNDND